MDDVAVIGFAFHLPAGADDESHLWMMLQEARNVMTRYPPSRVNIDAFYSPERKRNNTLYSKGAHFLHGDPTAFDAPFFSITKDEAASMDPQARKMMEVSYEALENAGVPMEKVAGSDTAVYASTMADDFAKICAKDPENNLPTTLLGTAGSIYAGRLSWFFDLRGPCLHIDTACSSSMIGVDLACQTLRNGTSSMALVVGSHLILSPEVSIAESNMLFLSPDGQSAAFTPRANGYGRGEGVVALILKRVTDAVASGDMIRAVIRGSGSNHDGRTQGVGRPSVEAQKTLIERVYKDARLNLTRTRYFEAHGTGTVVGDPTETKAIGRVFRTSRSPEEPLYVGSIKPNIGHIEAGSGIAGIIKTILILERGIILPNALFDTPNPDIDMKFYNLEVPTTCIPWPAKGLRRASISSFGLGGSNAHVILDDARHYMEEQGLSGYHCTVEYPQGSGSDHQIPPEVPCSTPNGATNMSKNSCHDTATMTRLLVFSAKDESALTRIAKEYSLHYYSAMDNRPKKLELLAYTLAEKRTKFPWRSFAVVGASDLFNEVNESSKEVIPKEMTLDIDIIRDNIKRADDTKLGLAFIFTGQGAQYAGMGLALMEYAAFNSTLRTISSIYREFGAKWDIVDEIRHGTNISTPEFSQPLCTAIQLALIELLRHWNVFPSIVIGHSSGEIAAAYAIGALNLRNACIVAYWRGKLASSIGTSISKPGAMLSINLSESAAFEYLKIHGYGEVITVACINSPSNVTLSGPAGSIEALHTKIEAEGIQAFQVRTGIAYHSPQMQEIAAQYLEHLTEIERTPVDTASQVTAMISTVTGRPISSSLVASAQYWVDNLTSPVRFAEAVQHLAKVESTTRFKLDTHTLRPVYDVLEVGPHAALGRPVIETLKQYIAVPGRAIRYSSILNRNQPGLETSLAVIGRLFTYGYPVNVVGVNGIAERSQKLPFLIDLPQYPFDHSLRYWNESRLSRDFRLRGGGTVESILGARVNDWNPLVPRWRKFVSTDSMPWVGDHLVTETPLFPATGMIVTALAAVQASSEIWQSGIQPGADISGFHIKEATFLRPIVVRSRVELITQSRPLKSYHGRSSRWCEVQIFTYTQTDEGESGTWAECFKAEIQMQYATGASKVDEGFESRSRIENVREEFKSAEQACTKQVSKNAFYTYHATHGLQYGPSFQLADELRCDAGKLAMGSVYEIPADRSMLVHPATLDAAFQICMLATWSKDMDKKGATLIPNRLSDGFIAASGWRDRAESRFKVLTMSELRPGGRGLDCRVVVLNNDGHLLCDIKQLQTSPIAKETTGSGDGGKELLYGITWKPLTSLMTREQMSSTCRGEEGTLDETIENYEADMVKFQTEFESLIDVIVRSTLAEMPGTTPHGSPAHLQHYVAWLNLWASTQSPTNIPDNPVAEQLDLDDAWKRLISLRPSWKLLVTIARNLSSILHDGMGPLELMFSSGEAEQLYGDICTHMCTKIRPLLALMTHENPTQRILEVGAGTGSMTSPILAVLQEQERRTGTLGFAQYMYTDISAAFFDAAQTRFATPESGGRILFKTLNLNQDIRAQGFESNSYDVVVAGSVLHATSNFKETLHNLRRALKPGGKLILLEITAPEKPIWNFTFGVLPDWWSSEQSKLKLSPIVDGKGWEILLKESGFSGNDLVVRDWNDPRCHNFSLIISTAIEETARPGGDHEMHRVVLVTAGSEDQQALTEALAREFHDGGKYTCKTVSLPFLSQSISSEDIVVFLLDMQSPILGQVDEARFEQIKAGLLRSKQMLWISNAAPSHPSFPLHSLSTGLLRSLRSEDVQSRIVTLNFEDEFEAVSNRSVILNIGKVFKASFEMNSPELEYAVRQNQICTPRLVYDRVMDASVRAAVFPSLRVEPWMSETAVKVTAATPGNLESLQFIEDPEYGTHLGPRHIEVEARSWGLSFRDLFLALGRLEEDDYGFECAGIVTRVGSECTNLSPGDRVCMAATACMRQYARCEEREAFRIPATMTFEEAASVAGPALTVVYSLVEVANLRRGEKILIHSASGSTGQVAVMLAQALGAEIYCTVGNKEKKQFLIDRFAIPKEHILDSRNTSFASGIKRLTKGYGVDVLLNSLSGDGLVAGWECMAPYGRFIEIGKGDIISNERLPMGGFKNNVSFSAIDFYHVARFRRDITQSMLTKVLDFVHKGKLKPPSPLHIYSASKIEEAFRYLQSGRHVGRIVIVPQREEVVPKLLRTIPRWSLDGNSSYLIVGGFGGLGRSILPWLAAKGARHLVVLSRSGPMSVAAAATVAQLTNLGVRIYAPKCNVSSESELREALQEAKEHLPPIRGCINGAMVLQDCLFTNMSHAQWSETVHSKTHSSMHLSSLLPPDLDFFILLSSLAGIYGTVAQSNYAASCTSQDALAYQRATKGLKAISLDIGWMRTVGTVAESELYQRVREREADMQQIEEDEFIAVLDLLCDPKRGIRNSESSQVLLGPVTPAHFRVRAEEIPHILERPLFSGFYKLKGMEEDMAVSSSDFLEPSALFKSAKTFEEKANVVSDALVGKLARALAIQLPEINTDKPLSNYGVDSLVAVELRNWMVKEFGSKIAVFDIMSGRSIVQISALVAEARST